MKEAGAEDDSLKRGVNIGYLDWTDIEEEAALVRGLAFNWTGESERMIGSSR
jgi:hypothetical protein